MVEPSPGHIGVEIPPGGMSKRICFGSVPCKSKMPLRCAGCPLWGEPSRMSFGHVLGFGRKTHAACQTLMRASLKRLVLVLKTLLQEKSQKLCPRESTAENALFREAVVQNGVFWRVHFLSLEFCALRKKMGKAWGEPSNWSKIVTILCHMPGQLLLRMTVSSSVWRTPIFAYWAIKVT